ncbi:MAG: ABC transporter permease [Actinomycetota bacterium]|nr:ABC transporter permease [Actinomycetota bacterium]
MRYVFGAAVLAATGLALAFLVLPVVALFVHVAPGDLLRALGTSAARDALLVSAKTSAIAHAAVLLVGTPAAYALARSRFAGRRLVLTLIELPLVLPPAVAGIALLVTFGRFGLLGGTLDALGLHIAFTQAAVVLAVAFVESPFYLRGAIASFESVDPALLDAARTLGAGPGRVFGRVAVPIAAGGLAAASALALARGLGEFGATILFAGSLQGVTQTLPLAIYSQFDVNLDTAIAIGALFVVFGAVVLTAIKLLPGWTRFASASSSAFRSASSAST